MKKKHYDIFISYRRNDVGDKAEHLHDLLDIYYRGRISFDRENLTGLFNVALIDRIDTVKDFVLVIGKKSFPYEDKDFTPESVAFYNKLATCSQIEFADTINSLGTDAPIDYVRIEIGRALHRAKTLHIIPVVPERTNDFSFSDLKLPPDIAAIKNYEAVFYSDNPDALFKDVVPKIRKHLQSRVDKPVAKFVGAVALSLVAVALIFGVLFGRSWMNDKEAFNACHTYADYYTYQHGGHRFFNVDCERIVKEFEQLERGGFAFVNNTSGVDKHDSIEVNWSDDITLPQLKALVGVLDSMMFIPSGTFVMGTDEPFDNEGPAHKVTLTKGFFMSKFELTRDVWYVVMNDSIVDSKDAHLPIVNISWEDSQRFVKKLGELTGLSFSLPTEAQWEYAATAGGRHKQFAGDGTLGELAWHRGNSMNRLHTTSESKSPNAFELYDMLGNVEEWCLDYAFEEYTTDAQIDPMGLKTGEKHIVRGGSYKSEPMDMTVTYRDAAATNMASDVRGMRIVIN